MIISRLGLSEVIDSGLANEFLCCLGEQTAAALVNTNLVGEGATEPLLLDILPAETTHGGLIFAPGTHRTYEVSLEGVTEGSRHPGIVSVAEHRRPLWLGRYRTLQAAGHVAAREIYRRDATWGFTYKATSMGSEELAAHMRTVIDTKWAKAPLELRPEHPRDSLTVAERTPVEDNLRRIIDEQYRPADGYHASNEFLWESPHGVELRLNQGAYDGDRDYYRGTLKVLHRDPSVQTTLPKLVDVGFVMNYGDRFSGNCQPPTSFFFKNWLTTEQRAELSSILTANTQSDSLTPDHAKAEFAVPLELCRKVTNDCYQLLRPKPQGAYGCGENNDGLSYVYELPDEFGRPSRVTLGYPIIGVVNVTYDRYDPRDPAKVPAVQLQHYLQISPQGILGLKTKERSRQEDTWRIDSRLVPTSPQDHVELIAWQLDRLLNGSKTVPKWGFEGLPFSE